LTISFTGIGFNPDIWEEFATKVGWRKFGNWLPSYELTFDTTAPEGHLPVGTETFLWGSSGRDWDSRVLHKSCPDL